MLPALNLSLSVNWLLFLASTYPVPSGRTHHCQPCWAHSSPVYYIRGRRTPIALSCCLPVRMAGGHVPVPLCLVRVSMSLSLHACVCVCESRHWQPSLEPRTCLWGIGSYPEKVPFCFQALADQHNSCVLYTLSSGEHACDSELLASHRDSFSTLGHMCFRQDDLAVVSFFCSFL